MREHLVKRYVGMWKDWVQNSLSEYDEELVEVVWDKLTEEEKREADKIIEQWVKSRHPGGEHV